MKWIPITVLCVGFLVGCSRPPEAASSATQPSPAPVTQPATEPTALLTIGEQAVAFPPALIRFTKQADGEIRGRLTTDDPAEAINSDYHGNSFDFELTRQSDVWKLRMPANAQSEDKLHGIFLDGHRRRLNPRDVTVRVEQTGSEVDVSLSGWFAMAEAVETEPVQGQAPKVVFVQGRLVASVIEQ
jgi:hypothetical protein